MWGYREQRFVGGVVGNLQASVGDGRRCRCSRGFEVLLGEQSATPVAPIVITLYPENFNHKHVGNLTSFDSACLNAVHHCRIEVPANLTYKMESTC